MKQIILLSLVLLPSCGVMTGHAHMKERPAFAEMDANGDGQLTPAEAEAYRTAKAAERFTATDTNTDGKLTAEEIIANADMYGGRKAKRRAARMIKKADTDGDDAVTQAELQAMWEDHSGGKNHMFDHGDDNGDGVISEEEYNAMKKHRRGWH